jgi:DNA-binding GntR family transcriptional regulator
MTDARQQPDPRAYMKLANRIKDQIADGELKPGDKITITSLKRTTGHSRQTIGKTMRVLERDGLIYRVPGLGYYISHPYR